MFARTRMPNADPELPRRARTGRARPPRRGARCRRVTAMSGARSVVVVGGGVSGLTTAYRLTKADPSLDVVVLEASDRSGRQARAACRSATWCCRRAPTRSWRASRGPWSSAGSSGSATSSSRPARPARYLWTERGLVRVPEATRRSGSPATSATCSAWPGLSRAGRRRARARPAEEQAQGRQRRDAGLAAAPPARRRGDRPSGGAAPRRPLRRRRRPAVGARDVPRAGALGGVAGKPDPRLAGRRRRHRARSIRARCSCGREAGSSGSPMRSPRGSGDRVRTQRASHPRSTPTDGRHRVTPGDGDAIEPMPCAERCRRTRPRRLVADPAPVGGRRARRRSRTRRPASC